MTVSTQDIISIIFLVEAEFAVGAAIFANKTSANKLADAIGVLMEYPDRIALSASTVMSGANQQQITEFAKIVGCPEDKVAEKITEYYQLINKMPLQSRRNCRKLAICVAFYDGEAQDQGKMLLSMSVDLALDNIEAQAKK